MRIKSVIHIVVSDEVVKSRILERAERENRPDDKVEVISTRIGNYKGSTAPVLDYFRNRKSVVEINGEQDENQVFSIIKESLV